MLFILVKFPRCHQKVCHAYAICRTAVQLVSLVLQRCWFSWCPPLAFMAAKEVIGATCLHSREGIPHHAGSQDHGNVFLLRNRSSWRCKPKCYSSSLIRASGFARYICALDLCGCLFRRSSWTIDGGRLWQPCICEQS